MPLTGALAVYLIPRRQVEEGNVIEVTVIVLHDGPLPLQVLTTYRFPSLSTWQKSGRGEYDGSTLNKVGS